MTTWGVEVEMHNVLGHERVEGNEQVAKEAKAERGAKPSGGLQRGSPDRHKSTES